MRIKRRNFIRTSLAAGAAMAVPDLLTGLAANTEPASQTLPWQRELPLREASKSVVLEGPLNPTDPDPGWGGEPFNGRAMAINNLKMRTTIWGPPERVTISLNKNNVWDRRLNIRSLQAPTLQDVIDGAFSPANENYVGRQADSQRPNNYGYLLKQGGPYDGYRDPEEYPFPCMKPVGQIILGMDPLAGATAPGVTQSCANGVVKLQVVKDGAKASLEYVLGMTNNIYAIRANFEGISKPIWLRLYRHRDTSHLLYMKDDGTYTKPGTEFDKAFNFPMESTSGFTRSFPRKKHFRAALSMCSWALFPPREESNWNPSKERPDSAPRRRMLRLLPRQALPRQRPLCLVPAKR